MRLLKVTTVLFALCLPLAVSADISAETVAAGKKATALVVLGKEEGYASAFCIDSSGLFVTNNHVVRTGESITLVLSPGEKDQQLLKAHAIRFDAKNDLALLKADTAKPLASLALADGSGLFEAMDVIAFGYPFGTALALKEGQYPNITVSTGHVTSLRKDAGLVKLIQIDASLNPGNSGGPLVNSKGQVVGVVAAGIPGTGINLAIPVSDLQALLVRPAITLSPVDISLLRQREEFEFVVQVISPGVPAPETTVELELSAGPGDSRTYRATRADDKTYRVKAVPLPGTGGAPLLQITVNTRGTEAVYRAPDQAIVINGTRTRLRLIRKIERGPVLTFSSGQTASGAVRGLDTIDVLYETGKKTIDLSRADSVFVEEVDPFASPAEYKVAVKRSGAVVGELTGVFGRSSPLHMDEEAGGRGSSPEGVPPAMWQPVTAGSKATARWSGRSAEITLPADAGGSPIFFAGFQSRAVLTGDFDVQVDYRLLAWPKGNGMRVGMRIAPPDGGEIGSVLHDNDGEESDHFTVFPPGGGAQSVYARQSPNLTGKLRIVRKDGVLTGLSWDPGANRWFEMGSGGRYDGEVRIVLMGWSDDNRFIHQEGKFALSNFTVTSGRWVAR